MPTELIVDNWENLVKKWKNTYLFGVEISTGFSTVSSSLY
jgi:hypothetical protein